MRNKSEASWAASDLTLLIDVFLWIEQSSESVPEESLISKALTATVKDQSLEKVCLEYSIKRFIKTTYEDTVRVRFLLYPSEGECGSDRTYLATLDGVRRLGALAMEVVGRFLNELINGRAERVGNYLVIDLPTRYVGALITLFVGEVRGSEEAIAEALAEGLREGGAAAPLAPRGAVVGRYSVMRREAPLTVFTAHVMRLAGSVARVDRPVLFFFSPGSDEDAAVMLSMLSHLLISYGKIMQLRDEITSGPAESGRARVVWPPPYTTSVGFLRELMSRGGRKRVCEEVAERLRIYAVLSGAGGCDGRVRFPSLVHVAEFITDVVAALEWEIRVVIGRNPEEYAKKLPYKREYVSNLLLDIEGFRIFISRILSKLSEYSMVGRANAGKLNSLLKMLGLSNSNLGLMRIHATDLLTTVRGLREALLSHYKVLSGASEQIRVIESLIERNISEFLNHLMTVLAVMGIYTILDPILGPILTTYTDLPSAMSAAVTVAISIGIAVMIRFLEMRSRARIIRR